MTEAEAEIKHGAPSTSNMVPVGTKRKRTTMGNQKKRKKRKKRKKKKKKKEETFSDSDSDVKETQKDATPNTDLVFCIYCECDLPKSDFYPCSLAHAHYVCRDCARYNMTKAAVP